jgi:hypothetical protein
VVPFLVLIATLALVLVLVLVPVLAVALVLDLVLVFVPRLGPGSGPGPGPGSSARPGPELGLGLGPVSCSGSVFCFFLAARFFPRSLLLRKLVSVTRGKNREQFEGPITARMFYFLESLRRNQKMWFLFLTHGSATAK